MRVELIGGPQDGTVINVPPQTLAIKVRLLEIHALTRPETDRPPMYSIVFDERRPLRALFCGWK